MTWSQDIIEEQAETILKLRVLLRGENHIEHLFRCQSVFNIQNLVAEVLLVLLRRGPVSIDRIMAIVYEGDVDLPMDHVIRVHIVKLRKALKPHRIKIQTVWGIGYAMSDEMKSRTLKFLELEAV